MWSLISIFLQNFLHKKTDTTIKTMIMNSEIPNITNILCFNDEWWFSEWFNSFSEVKWYNDLMKFLLLVNLLKNFLVTKFILIILT